MPKLVKTCGAKKDDKIPTARNFLKRFKDTTTNERGMKIFIKYMVARNKLLINYIRKSRGFVTALCSNPCKSSELIENEKILVNKASFDASAEDYKTAKKELEDARKILVRAVEYYVEAFGKKDNC